MGADIQQAVLTLCVDNDTVAYQVYAAFAATEEDPAVRKLWTDLGRDEADHIRYWNLLLRQLRSGSATEVFANPTALQQRLEDARRRMHQLLSSIGKDTDLEQKLSIACLMELMFLDHSLLQALRFVGVGEKEENALEAYRRHLQSFLAGVGAHGTSLELRLSAETLRRLWESTEVLLDRTHMDPLTGLLNRRGFQDAVFPLASLARRRGAPIAVAMVDIDRFKSINDTHGHDAGDRVLVSMAATIRDSVRGSDVVARFGGEEFVVFLSDLDTTHLPEVGEKIRAGVEKHAPGGIAVTVSVGLASASPPRDARVEETLEALIKQADANLYRAKNTGRNRVVV